MKISLRVNIRPASASASYSASMIIRFLGWPTISSNCDGRGDCGPSKDLLLLVRR